ncbi:hypothetical protein CERSUDRAFT_100741 [Gelatoporia subvermispora B]|uniref:Uncharacterized protein n=1 Tax=Ceriporiopsis subvermispora (strain B) TaxID=914234 RepID=M2QYM0_CERS8|nr:hypothetical protein CERSUDRAFT_100741 [Gelatoporia subvermispora B]
MSIPRGTIPRGATQQLDAHGSDASPPAATVNSGSDRSISSHQMDCPPIHPEYPDGNRREDLWETLPKNTISSATNDGTADAASLARPTQVQTTEVAGRDSLTSDASVVTNQAGRHRAEPPFNGVSVSEDGPRPSTPGSNPLPDKILSLPRRAGGRGYELVKANYKICGRQMLPEDSMPEVEEHILSAGSIVVGGRILRATSARQGGGPAPVAGPSHLSTKSGKTNDDKQSDSGNKGKKRRLEENGEQSGPAVRATRDKIRNAWYHYADTT